VWGFSSGATLGSAPTPNLSTFQAIGFKHSCLVTELTSGFNSKLMLPPLAGWVLDRAKYEGFALDTLI
jgi:hypothetical protein